MIKINNRKLEAEIKEILQNSRFASVEDICVQGLLLIIRVWVAVIFLKDELYEYLFGETCQVLSPASSASKSIYSLV